MQEGPLCPHIDTYHPTKAQMLAYLSLLFLYSEEKQEEGREKANTLITKSDKLCVLSSQWDRAGRWSCSAT